MQLFLPIASTMIEAFSIESATVVASSEESAAVVASSVKASAIDVPFVDSSSLDNSSSSAPKERGCFLFCVSLSNV